MKVAILGWYGHDNAGDERIKFCLEYFLRSLGGFEAIEFFDLHEEAINGESNKFDSYDLVIIGGGGLIVSQHNYHDFVIGLQSKLLVLGVSVETDLKGNPRKFVEAMLEKALVFMVRDQVSYEKIRKINDSKKLSFSRDLTFLNPYKMVDYNSDSLNIGVNLFDKSKPEGFFKSILRTIPKVRYHIPYQKYSYLNIIKMLEDHGELKPLPLYCKKDSKIDSDIALLDAYFPNVPDHFDHRAMDDCRFIFSMRLHGLIFAVQKGIPIMTFNSFPKQVNLMKELNMSDYLIDINTESYPERLALEIIENSTNIKSRFQEYVDESKELVKKEFLNIINQVQKR